MRQAAVQPPIGRGHELGVLRRALEEARAGCGRLVLVLGDAGIGKTRLIEALVEEAMPTAARVTWGRCWEGGAAAAYWPWVQILRGSIADVPTDVLASWLGAGACDVVQLLPELTSRLPGLVPSAPLDSPQGRQRLFDSVAQLLAAVAADHGVLIVAIEDLHAADEASLQLLRRLARNITCIPLLVVCSYRETDVRGNPDRRRLLDSIAAHGDTLLLPGLDRAGISALLGQIGGRRPTEALVGEVQRVTEGNPLFVREVARLLSSEGRDDSVRLPEEVHALIRRRLQPIPASVRQVLIHAAVLGQQFELTTLRQLAGSGADEVVDALGVATDLGVVSELALGRWSFSHSLIREALYQQLQPKVRRTLHARAGAALEELTGADGDPYLSQLAYHLWAAGASVGSEKAVVYCVRAAESAMAALAYGDAADWYQKALGVLRHSPQANTRRHFDVLMACAEAEWRSQGFGPARETYGKALRVARKLGSGELIGRVALASADHGGDGSILEEALSLLPDDDLTVRPHVVVHHATLQTYRDPDASDAWLENARWGVDAARRGGDDRALAKTLFYWHRALHNDPHGIHERLTVSAEMVALAKRAANHEELFAARAWRIDDLFEAGDIAAVRHELVRLAGDAHKTRIQFHDWVLAMMRATLTLHEGQIEEADRLAHAALAIGERLETPEVENIFACQIVEIRRHQGRFAELEKVARQVIQQFPDEVGATLALALALAELGCPDEARKELDRVGGTRDPASIRGESASYAWPYLADVTWALGDTERAPVLYHLLQPRAGHHVTMPIVAASAGSTDLRLALLATLLERWDEAEAHFQAAHLIHGALGARGWLAHGELGHARMLLARGGAANGRRAAELVTRARETYLDLGMSFYGRRAGELLKVTSRSTGRRATFRREDDGWAIEYDGMPLRLHDSKGLQYLAVLLSHPDETFAATELVGQGQTVSPDHARRRVSRAVKSAIDHVADVHAVLGAHLRAAVRVGTSASYVPDARAPLVWETDRS